MIMIMTMTMMTTMIQQTLINMLHVSCVTFSPSYNGKDACVKCLEKSGGAKFSGIFSDEMLRLSTATSKAKEDILCQNCLQVGMA